MRKDKVLFVVLLALLAVALVPSAQAQTSNGVIAGTITDKTGAVVPGATVAVSSESQGVKRTSTTDSVGAYRIESLLPGRYIVVVTASSFAELKISGVDVRGSFTTTVNGTLEVSGVTATVTVEAGVGQELQTQSGELSANITRAEINNLPVFGLNPIALVLTYAGVTAPAGRDDFTNGVGFSVNGTRPRANNFLIDGQDNNDNSIQGQAFQPINHEAYAGVTILTNAYSSEFGRGGGSVTNVISRSGTNKFHGALWEIYRGNALAAVPAESALGGVTENPRDVENIFGFSFGGPVVKNKFFFFGTMQWDRARSDAAAATLPIRIPTAAGVATLQALTSAQANLANRNFLIDSLGGLRGVAAPFTLVALGNGLDGVARSNVQFGLVTRAEGSVASNDRQLNVKLDWVPGTNDIVSFRYIRDDGALNPDFFNFPTALPPYDSQQGGPSQTYGGAWIHTFSPQMVNEFRVSYTQIAFEFGPTSATAANPLFTSPRITIGGTGLPGIGFPSNLPQGRGHKTWQYQDAVSYTVGTHTLKFGVDITHLSVRDAIPFNTRGTIGFASGGDCGAVSPTTGLPVVCPGLANFIDNFSGPSAAISKVFGSPITQPFITTYAPYVQDSWHFRPNLTFTLGLRYEYWGTPENILDFPAINPSQGFGFLGVTFPTMYAFQQQGDKNNWAPRIGFAWTPRFMPSVFGNDKTVLRAGYGIFFDGLFTNILDNTAGTSPNAVGGTITAPSGATRGLANAFGLLASVTSTLSPTAAVNSITNNLVNPMTHQWNLDVQRELPGNFVVTAAYVGTRGIRLYANQQFNPGVNGVRVNPVLGSVIVRGNFGDSFYHSGQLTVDRRFTKGFLLRGAYTFSRLIDTASEVFTTTGLSSTAQDPFNQKGDRGLSAFHRAHNLALTYIWELPYLRNVDNAGLKVLNAVIRDWQVAGTVFFRSGVPQTVSVALDRNRDLNGGNDRPNLAVPGGNPYDPATYSTPALDTLGNVGRNTVITEGRQDWNFSVQRTIKIPMGNFESQALMFRAEFFNVFNHPNLGIPSLRLDDPSFGDTSETIFGGRQIRFWLKYSF